MSDRLHKFLFADAPVRGGAVRLHTAWQRMIEHHAYPTAVQRLLGEMTAAAALLATSIKFDGTLILQVQGDGPVQLLVVECRADLALRATAKLRDGAAIAADAGLADLVNAHGRGRCTLVLDPRDRQPGQTAYQGIVELTGDSVAAAIEAYLQRSEQIDSRLWLAANGTTAAGLLLQKLPAEGGRLHDATGDPDAWPRAQLLADTIQPTELLTLEPAALVRRLYGQERLEPYPPLAPRFECTCSRERIGRMLVSLGRAEVDSILAERGEVEVVCDFCNARRVFDAVDVGQLFTSGASALPPAGMAH